jgi:hypothetical protein
MMTAIVSTWCSCPWNQILNTLSKIQSWYFRWKDIKILSLLSLPIRLWSMLRQESNTTTKLIQLPKVLVLETQLKVRWQMSKSSQLPRLWERMQTTLSS